MVVLLGALIWKRLWSRHERPTTVPRTVVPSLALAVQTEPLFAFLGTSKDVTLVLVASSGHFTTLQNVSHSSPPPGVGEQILVQNSHRTVIAPLAVDIKKRAAITVRAGAHRILTIVLRSLWIYLVGRKSMR